MKQASQNYFFGTLLKTPVKAYLAGSSLHVALKEFFFALQFLFSGKSLQNPEYMAAMIERAVRIYIPATEPSAFILNCILGVVAVGIWTVRYDNATNF